MNNRMKHNVKCNFTGIVCTCIPKGVIHLFE